MYFLFGPTLRFITVVVCVLHSASVHTVRTQDLAHHVRTISSRSTTGVPYMPRCLHALSRPCVGHTHTHKVYITPAKGGQWGSPVRGSQRRPAASPQPSQGGGRLRTAAWNEGEVTLKSKPEHGWRPMIKQQRLLFRRCRRFA